jgi:hypothetical protein
MRKELPSGRKTQTKTKRERVCDLSYPSLLHADKRGEGGESREQEIVQHRNISIKIADYGDSSSLIRRLIFIQATGG